MLNIAIDGPAGAGKSSVAREVAKRLNIQYIDTGAMYRAIALKAIKLNIALDDETAIVNFLNNTEIFLRYDENQAQQIFLDGINVSEEIRKNGVSEAASAVAMLQGVRAALVKIQQGLAANNHVVMDGRDIASVVLPNATLKVYLDASPKVRARRRMQQLGLNDEASFQEILNDVNIRDQQDINRRHSPLVKVEDAFLIDSSNLPFESVADQIISLLPDEYNSL